MGSRPFNDAKANAHPLVKRVFAIMREQNANTLHLAERAGVCRNAIWHWGARRQEPKLGHLIAVLQAMGYDLVIVKKNEP